MFTVTFVFVVLKLNLLGSIVGILRWMRAEIFSGLVSSFFSTVTS